MGERNKNLVYPTLWDFKRSLTCRKILRHGISGFTSHPKKGVLRIFIALKKSIALAGFEPASSGSSGKHTNHYTTKVTDNVSHSSLLGLRSDCCSRDFPIHIVYYSFLVYQQSYIPCEAKIKSGIL
jgi:hypothetical protein